jgi:leucyl/phenylalanyl-tRNA--protein transferase
MEPGAITPEILLNAYAIGIFPMAEARDAPDFHWVDPQQRGILPLQGFHISRSLSRRIRRWDCTIRTDSDFPAVVRACADRDETWINAPLFTLYQTLHEMGFAHSVEVWSEGRLAGGVFGIALGGAFFGESMFSRETGGSKVALAHCVHRLRAGGFGLFDTQFLTPHLASLGGVAIPRTAYRRLLQRALALNASFFPPGYGPSPSEVASSGASGATSGGS